MCVGMCDSENSDIYWGITQPFCRLNTHFLLKTVNSRFPLFLTFLIKPGRAEGPLSDISGPFNQEQGPGAGVSVRPEIPVTGLLQP